jgi:hypothetical protein
MMLVEHLREIDAHEPRAAREAGARRDLDPAAVERQLDRLDAAPPALAFPHEVLGESVHGSSPRLLRSGFAFGREFISAP